MEEAGRDESCKRSGNVAGLFGGEGKLRADGFVGGILDEGDGGVGRGLVPAVLLGESEREVVMGERVERGFGEGGAVGLFGGGEIAASIRRGGGGGGVLGFGGGCDGREYNEEEDRRDEREEVAGQEKSQR